jgi:hypothetical protein
MGCQAGRGADALYGGLTERLEGLDAAPDLVIFECELSDTAWLEFCLRQADRIMTLIDGDQWRTSCSDLDWLHDAKLGERTAQLELAVVYRRSTDLGRDYR